jgi:hypothetical protein
MGIAEIDALTAQAKANEDAEDSAALVINGIATSIQTAVAAADSLSATDRANLVALTAALKTHADALAAAVVANTPAAAPAAASGA